MQAEARKFSKVSEKPNRLMVGIVGVFHVSLIVVSP